MCTCELRWPATLWQNLASFKVGQSMTKEVKVDSHSFDVCLYPHGFNKRTEKFVSLWLKRKTEKEVNVKLCCSFMVGDGKVLLKKTIRKDLAMESVLGWASFCSRFVVLNDEFSELRDQSLRLVIKVTVFGPQSMPNPELENDHESFLCELSNELLHCYTVQSCTDIKIKVAKNNQPVHKAILASRSNVFRISLRYVKNNDAVDVHSPTDAIFLETIMKYIYSGKVGYHLCSPDTKQVYTLAHNYKLFTLKDVCRKLITSNLNVNNVVKILLIAHKHDDYELEESCLVFMDTNLRFIKGKPDWIRLMSNFSTLANKALFFRDKRK